MALGLINAYFPGIEDLSLEWLAREPEQHIREALIDHFVEHSERSAIYEDSAKDAYQRAAGGSILRAKLEARAEGRPIYREFRKIDLQASSKDFDFGGGLFGSMNVNNNTFNVNASNIGVVAGTSSVEGGVHQQAVNHTQQAQAELQRLLTLLEKEAGHGRAAEGSDLARTAKKKPSKSTVEKVLQWMRVAKSAGDLAAAGAHDFSQIGDQLHTLLQHLPAS